MPYQCLDKGPRTSRRCGLHADGRSLLCTDTEQSQSLSLELATDEAAAEPRLVPRPRGLWGVASKNAKSGSAGPHMLLQEPLQQDGALESNQAPCRGTSLVGSGISMSALSSAFQV